MKLQTKILQNLN